MSTNDLRLAARALSKSPLFSLGVVGLLAFGMAACLVIFTLVDIVLLRPLPVRDPASLVRFVSIHPPLPPMGDFRIDEFEAWKREAVGSSFAELIAWSTGDAAVTVGRGTPSESVRVDFVSENYFSALGVDAALGTLLTTAEGSAPAVLSYPYWQRRFGGDRSVIGQTLEFEGHKVTIVGVTAKGFNGLTLETSPDLRLPAKWMRELRFVAPDVYQYVGYEVAGRLRPGVSLEAARQEAERIWTSVRKSDQTGTAMLDAKLELQSAAKGISRLRGPFGGVLWMVLAGVALLLLIVCANAAGLLVTRAAGRESELALRAALGATRGQLAGPLVAEAVMLLAGATVLAAALTYAALPVVAGSLPPVRDQGTVRLTLSLDLVPDLRVAAVGLGISALTLVLFGLLPAWATVMRNRYELQRTLQQARHRRHTGRQLLIAVQVALCTILLCGAGLTLLTLDRLRGLDPGFDAGRVVTFTVDRGLEKYEKAQILDLQRRLLAGARALPEVDSAAIATRGLMRGSGIKMTVLPAGEAARREDFMNTSLNSVTPDYFATMRMKWVAGRNFVEGEVREGVPTPVVVNEAFARKLGARLGGKFGSSIPRGGKPAEPQFEVIGIVGDAKYRSLREPMQPTLYSPLGANPSLILHVHTRTARPEVIMQPVRRLLAEADPRLSFVEVSSLAVEVADSIWPERAAAWLASLFAGAAMVIVAAGLYALAAFAVMQRRREIGIRMALGALPGDILRLMLTRVAWLSLCGASVGMVCSWLLAPRMATVLYEVQARDPRSLSGAVGVVLGVTIAAALLPSLRAARMAPAAVLREE